MRRTLMPVLIALCLAGAALAQQAIVPPPPGAAIVMQSAVMQAGEERTYRLDTLVQSEIEDGARPERSQKVFRIEVIKADPEGLVLAYTQFSSVGTAFPPLGAALNGRQIQFEADPSGYPRKVINWPAQRSGIVDHLQKNNGEALIPAVQALTEDGVIDNLLADAVLLASMQSLPAMPAPKVDDPPRTPAEGVRITGFTEFQGSRAADCTFIVRRVTELDPASAYARDNKVGQRLETIAYNSMVDGWVMGLDETTRRAQGPRNELIVKKLARQGQTGGRCELQASAPAGK